MRTGLHLAAAEATDTPRPIAIETAKTSKSFFMYPLLLRCSPYYGQYHHSNTATQLWVVGEPRAELDHVLAEFAGNLEAAGPGFEPGLSDSESLVLPLHHPARQRRIL